jgi:acyl-CoA reductase-like NAD-dependent aldehyde dehydrogenase
MATKEVIDRLLNAAESGEILNIENFINGKFVSTFESLDSVDPAIGKVWIKVPRSQENEVNEAVAAAKAAFPEWSKTSVQHRSKLLNKVADILEPLSENLAILESIDQGKTIATAKTVDIPRCIHNFRTFASAILHHTGT